MLSLRHLSPVYLSPVIFYYLFLYFGPVLLEFELWKLQVPASTQASGFCIELFVAFLSSVCLAGYFLTCWVPSDCFLAFLLKAAVPIMKTLGHADKYWHLWHPPVRWLCRRHKLWLCMRWSCKVFAGFGARPFRDSMGTSLHRVVEGLMDFPQVTSSWSFLLILLRWLLSIILRIKLALGPLTMVAPSVEADRL